MRSHIDWREQRNISYKGRESSPYYTRFKTVNLIAILNRQKRTISAGSKLIFLQMVLEIDIEQCLPVRTLAIKEVDYETQHQLERRTKHSV